MVEKEVDMIIYSTQMTNSNHIFLLGIAPAAISRTDQVKIYVVRTNLDPTWYQSPEYEINMIFILNQKYKYDYRIRIGYMCIVQMVGKSGLILPPGQGENEKLKSNL